MPRKLTKKQIQANRERAKKSTGPRTPEGKARSAMNALKNGLYAETLLLWGENDRLLAEITRQFFEDFPPANIHERMLLEQMIFTQWRMLRVARSRVPNTRDWDLDLNRALGQEKIYGSLHRSYAKAAAQLERSRAGRGALPPVVHRDQAPPIPVDGYDDPQSQVNSPPTVHKPKEIDSAGFVPEKSSSPTQPSQPTHDVAVRLRPTAASSRTHGAGVRRGGEVASAARAEAVPSGGHPARKAAPRDSVQNHDIAARYVRKPRPACPFRVRKPYGRAIFCSPVSKRANLKRCRAGRSPIGAFPPEYEKIRSLGNLSQEEH